MGFGPVPPEHAVDWTLQIDVAGRAPAQRSKRIDGRLPRSLIALPRQISGEDEGTDYASLANRDLQRGQAVGLPSGEAVARELGVAPLAPDQVGLAGDGWERETPLWLYVLKEAEALEDGDRLGPSAGGSSARSWSGSSTPTRSRSARWTPPGRRRCPRTRPEASGSRTSWRPWRKGTYLGRAVFGAVLLEQRLFSVSVGKRKKTSAAPSRIATMPGACRPTASPCRKEVFAAAMICSV